MRGGRGARMMATRTVAQCVLPRRLVFTDQSPACCLCPGRIIQRRPRLLPVAAIHDLNGQSTRRESYPSLSGSATQRHRSSALTPQQDDDTARSPRHESQRKLFVQIGVLALDVLPLLLRVSQEDGTGRSVAEGEGRRETDMGMHTQNTLPHGAGPLTPLLLKSQRALIAASKPRPAKVAVTRTVVM
jgi:hypothetical protein